MNIIINYVLFQNCVKFNVFVSLFKIIGPALTASFIGYMFSRYSSLLDKHENYITDIISSLREDYESYSYSIGMISTLVQKYIADSEDDLQQLNTNDFLVFKEHFLNATLKASSFTLTKAEVCDKFNDSNLIALFDDITTIMDGNVKKILKINEVVFMPLKPSLNRESREFLKDHNVSINNDGFKKMLLINEALRNTSYKVFSH